MRTIGKSLGACTGFALLVLAAQVNAATVVTDNVVSQATLPQNHLPVTFGQVFKAGDVPAGATLTASLNGQPITLQVDTKATNPDGSLRHAVLTAIVPSLQGSATLPLTLTTASASQGQGSPISLSQLLATNYDANISLSVNGRPYSISARKLLQTASSANTCKPWGTQCNVWLSGSLVSEWIVNGVVTAADGTPNLNLRVSFAVRAYAGAAAATVGDVRTDIIVENTAAFAPQAQPQYTATLTSGSATYTTPKLTQYAYTRWHKLLWWNNVQPQVYLQQDTQYIQASKAVSRYMSLTPDESFLAGLRQSCAPLDYCDQTMAQSDTGAHPAIGPLPRWTSVYLIHPDVRAYRWMLANTDALGTYSAHYRDAATGWPLSIQQHPYVTLDDWSWASKASQYATENGRKFKADLLPGCINNSVVTSCSSGWYGTGNPYGWSNAHQPAAAYVAYMVTGSYYYMEEIAYYASMNELSANETFRGLSQGLIDAARSQVRGKAWVLREMADAAWLLPNGYPLKAEFNDDVNNSIANFNTTYTHNSKANPLGMMNSGSLYSMNGGFQNGGTPWQHNFLIWSAGHAADLGFAGAADFRNWLAKFEIGLMTDWQTSSGQGFCWLSASAYNLQLKDAAGNWLPSYTAVYAATFPTLKAYTCNSPAMITAMGALYKQPWQPREMPGYPTAATGFPANFQIGVATAADSGLPNAQNAWNLFQSRSPQPSGSTAYNNYPNYAIVPRSVPGAVPSPPVSPSPAPSQPVNPPVNPPVSPPVNSPPVKSAELWQTLATSEQVIHVGDTFTVSGTLHYPAGMTTPVTAYRLYGFDNKILSLPSGWSPKFVAKAVGTTQIANDSSGVTGVVTITVIPRTNQLQTGTTPPPAKLALVGQTLTVSRKVIVVGDTFTVAGRLTYSDGSSAPVTAYRLHDFNGKILSIANGWSPQFVATAAGTTLIENDNSGVTGVTTITVLPAPSLKSAGVDPFFRVIRKSTDAAWYVGALPALVSTALVNLIDPPAPRATVNAQTATTTALPVSPRASNTVQSAAQPAAMQIR